MENGIETKALRWSRILRPVFIINLEGRQVRERGFYSSFDFTSRGLKSAT
jgi:hypothetical protein